MNTKEEKVCPKIYNVYLTCFPMKSPDNFELIFDFNNDKHHAVRFKKGMNRKEIACALRGIADNLERDKLLDGE